MKLSTHKTLLAKKDEKKSDVLGLDEAVDLVWIIKIVYKNIPPCISGKDPSQANISCISSFQKHAEY